MSKKISFKRPETPVSAAADDWVGSADDAAPAPESTSEAKPKAKRAASRKPKARKSKTAERPVTDTAGKTTPTRSGASSNARWIDHMLASVDRQSDFVVKRLSMLAPGDTADDPALARIDARAAAIIERMQALRDKVKGG